LARATRQGHPVEGQLVVLHTASRSWEFAYREEFVALAEEFPWLTYLPSISRPWEDPEWQGEVGRAEDVLRKYVDQLRMKPEDTTVYLCGHPQMIENSKGILRRRGFAKGFIRSEIY